MNNIVLIIVNFPSTVYPLRLQIVISGLIDTPLTRDGLNAAQNVGRVTWIEDQFEPSLCLFITSNALYFNNLSNFKRSWFRKS